MAKTCVSCRERKVRCDGESPCGPCSKARRRLECSYMMPSTPTPKGPLLQKGAACYPCRKLVESDYDRRKKKRCDAQRPFCTTCKIAGKEYDCQYEDNVERSLTEALLARTKELEDRLAVYETSTQGSLSVSSSTSPLSEQAVEPPPYTPPDLNDFLTTLLEYQQSTATFVPGLHITSAPNIPYAPPTTSIMPTLPSPQQAIHPLTDHHFLSTAYQDLEEFRALFVSHHGQLGLFISEPKVQAIVVGDLTGNIVHPVLVYTAQLMGCRLWQERHRNVSTVTTEQYQLQSVMQGLMATSHPVTRIQVHNVLTIYFLIKRYMQEGREQLMKGAHLAMHYNLQFHPSLFPVADALQEPSIEAREQICALSQMLYLEKAATIVLNEPTLLSAELDANFRSLPYVFPSVAKRNLVVLRARSVFLLHITRLLSARWSSPLVYQLPSQCGLDPNAHLLDEYWPLLEEVTEHIAVLLPLMLKTTAGGDREHGLALKLCMLVSLTASAELHRLLASRHMESRLKCLDVVFEIVGITKSLKDDDYIFLDPILGICWQMVAEIFKQERQQIQDKYSTVHWKSLLSVVVHSASRLGHTLPFMENSLETITDVASSADGRGSGVPEQSV